MKTVDTLKDLFYGEEKSAVFSPCRTYRYELWRRWDTGPYCMFIGLNPSTADETNDDPTVRRCIAFSKSWGYSALCMTNLFAYRSTDPRKLHNQVDPVGPDNDSTLIKIAKDAGIVIAAWGTHGEIINRHQDISRVLMSITTIYCLGITKDHYPKHPLYLPKNLNPEVYYWSQNK